MALVSIVDYLKAKKQDASFANRAKLAAQYGIKNYKGTAQQNIALLNALQRQNNPATKIKKPVVTTGPRKPVVTTGPRKPAFKDMATIVTTGPKKLTYKDMTTADRNWYNTYSGALVNGTADPTQYQRYLTLAKTYGLKTYSISEDALRQLSLKALAGDVNAQNYLKSMHLNPMTGQSLWKGVTTDQLNKSQSLRWAYMKDNPYADYTKNYDYVHYQKYNDMIKNNQPLTPQQIEWYKNTVQKWNLDNLLDPYIRQAQQMQQDENSALQQYQNDEKAALAAQDVALNNALFQADRDNFQRFLDVQQQMADRGLTGSGIAADAYLRSQMAANQAYQDAFAQAAQNKANIQAEYDDKIAQMKSQYTDKIAEARAASRAYIDALKDKEAERALEIQKLQTDQDKFLTAQTGYVFLNGKPLKHSDGRPYTTVELQKLFEEVRHNRATEANERAKINADYALGKERNAITAQGNLLDYQLGKERNAITAQGNLLDYQARMAKSELDKMRIATDARIAAAKLKYAYAKLSLDKQKAQASINEANARLDIMAKNARTSEVRTKITAIKTQLSALQKQINARLKAGKKPTKAQRNQLKGLMNQLEVLVSGK